MMCPHGRTGGMCPHCIGANAPTRNLAHLDYEGVSITTATANGMEWIQSGTEVRLIEKSPPADWDAIVSAGRVDVVAQEPARPGWGAALFAIVVAVLIACGLTLALTSCSASQARTTATITIVSAGTAVTGLQMANHASYRTATDDLMARGVIGHDYDVATRPIDAEFRARGEAIQAIAAVLYASAAIVDTTRDSADFSSHQQAAVESLAAIQRAVEVLRRGAVLPALAIPSEVTLAIAALQAIAGGSL